MADETISIIIVDDHEMVRTGLRSMLAAPGIAVVGAAGSGEEALELINRLKPDIVLMDIRMPDMDGIAALEKIHLLEHHPRVIMMTTYKSSKYLLRSLAAGAAGFVLKDISRQSLLAIVQRVASGEQYVDQEFLQSVLEELGDSFQPEVTPDYAWVTPLSPREHEVLQLMAEGMTNQSIAYVLQVSAHTVKDYVKHICQKLDAASRTEAVVKAIRGGLVK
ncbi:MAG: response regulator transcription factor [Anaerolineae bacterium]|nr:response regulator transcription factor [Anaerolineae bacterium]